MFRHKVAVIVVLTNDQLINDLHRTEGHADNPQSRIIAITSASVVGAAGCEPGGECPQKPAPVPTWSAADNVK